MLAALSGRDVPARASDGYLAQTYDAFADTFEHVLTALGYRAPEILVAQAASVLAGREGTLDVLDAGCGTGLCAPLLRPLARRLTGVDLSAGMLARARARGLYDDLAQTELTGFLRERPRSFDLIVAGDTLIYFGDLATVLEAAAGALRAGGVMVFNLEDGGAEAAPAGYRLQANGRYEHDGASVLRDLVSAGFPEPALRREPLRREQDRTVTGLFVLARRPEGGGPCEPR
jgi:predicted TPR repeat methyltransferase